MEDVRLIHSVDKPSNLRSIVKQDLREHGIKVPKQKKSKKLNQSRNLSQDGLSSPYSFGNYLSMVPSKYVPDCGFVPNFLVDAVEIIEHNCRMEGIFRKSGSVSRQKELKQQIEDGQRLQSDNVHDVTGLVKQFFRELPEPLFTSLFHDSFIRCYHLHKEKQVEAMLLLCLMLPMEHLSVLRYTMKFLARLASHSAHNKMDVGNLAVVLAPNIMHVNSRSQKMNSTEEKLLQIQTAIVELLIHNADSIGTVSDSLSQRTALMTEYFGTEDELDASDDNTLEDSKDCKETKKKSRKRSNSLQGIVSSIGRGFAKLRRSTEGKNTSTAGGSCQDTDTAMASDSTSLSGSEHQGELTLPPHDQPLATPVVMRKRKMSGETVPFSASKRKAILDQLPQKCALGSTPFTPASSKKHHHSDMRRAGHETPYLPATDKNKAMPSATPRHDINKSIRKKINLFSPASARKAKSIVPTVSRCKSSAGSSNLCSSALRKSGRTKHLFKRLSAGKDKMCEENEDHGPDSPSGVPQSQSAMELSFTDKSSLGLTRTVSSPSLHDSPEDPSDLNQGFIDPDQTACMDTTSQSGRGRERGRTLRRDESFRPGHKPERRSSSTDGVLRRGQPNKLCNGLLEGKTENVRKLRRSFDKSDISHPIPVIVPTLPQRPTSSCTVTADMFRPVSSTFVPDRSRPVCEASDKTMDRSSQPLSEACDKVKAMEVDMESSLLNVVLPPPSDFKDMSLMEVDNDRAQDNMQGSDDESEAGFSTISGGTVIHRPRAHLHSLQATQAGTAGNIVHYGSSVSVAASLQPSVSADSLISTDSESSEAGPVAMRRMLDRSGSIDSGKGSLLDGSEAALSSRNRHVKSSDVEKARVQLEGSSFLTSDSSSSHFNPAWSVKSVSAEDLKATRIPEKPATRSHSMYVGSSTHPQNIVPNLQISAETHRLLTRAGFLETSLPPNVKDTVVPFKSPQKSDTSYQSFRRDRHQCSFRLEKSGTFRKERSSILFAKHPTPVKEEVSLEQRDTCEEQSQCNKKEQSDEPMEDVWVLRTPGSCNPPERASQRQEVHEESEAESQPVSAVTQEREAIPQPPISLKRAELRMQKHDSILHIKESSAGRVAQSIQHINTSLDQSNTSLHFQQCTSRKRGVSPVRIPSIFAKAKTDPSSAYYQELAQRFHKKTENPSVRSALREGEADKPREVESAPGSQPSQSVNTHVDPSDAARQCQKKRESAYSSVGSADIDLSSSLLQTIEEVITPHRRKRTAGSQHVDMSRSPLREFTNTKSSAVEGDGLQLRTSKGLTPHQVLKYGPKAAGSERSPGKPVKRLNSPHSPRNMRSPQKTDDREALRLESCHFQEQY